jgi:DNA-directed RNA polymerase specialized sigma24 family protein
MNNFGGLIEKKIPRLRRYARALTRDVSRADDLVEATNGAAITDVGSKPRRFDPEVGRTDNSDLLPA